MNESFPTVVGKDGTTTMGLFPLGEVVKAKIWCNVSLRLFVLHSMNVNKVHTLLYPDTTAKVTVFSSTFLYPKPDGAN